MRNLVRIILVLMGLTMIGTLWFRFYEKWTWIESLYMTVITLTTVGYREVRLPSPGTQLFIVVFLVTGIGFFMYGVVELGEIVLRAELTQWWKRRNMNQELKTLRGHFIVAGIGRMGLMVCRQLADAEVPFVAVDKDEEALDEVREYGWRYLEGDATDDRVLEAAGIEHAAGVATVLSSDADNLYVVLSAKILSPKVRLIARAFDDKGAEKMKRAGADQVVSMYANGATKMAQLLTNPKMGDFFEVLAMGHLKLDLAEIQITPTAPMVGRLLAETDYRERGVMIVAIQQGNGKVLMPPPAETRLQSGDHLFAIGDSEAIAELVTEF